VNSGERRATRHYLLRCWRLVAANARVGRNEVDLILRCGRRLLVVEVKEKTGDEFGDPLRMIDAEKLRRVRSTAQAWLAAHPELAGLEVGFEAVGVSPRRLNRVRIEPGDE
jgi:putative endonuclease